MGVNYLKVGDLIKVEQDGHEILGDFEVTRVYPVGDAGRRYGAGQRVCAKLVGGKGYSVSFDNDSTYLRWRKLTSEELKKGA